MTYMDALKRASQDIQKTLDRLNGPSILTRMAVEKTDPVAERFLFINGAQWRQRRYKNGMICLHGPNWAIIYTSNPLKSLYIWF